MATFVLYEYVVNGDFFPRVGGLRDFLKSSIEIYVQRKNAEREPSVLLYSYVEQNDMLCLKNPPLVYPGQIPPLYFLSTDVLFNDKSVLSITIITRRKIQGLAPKSVKEITDWAKMITDLEEAEKIVVSKTNSVFAVDQRRFYFVGDSEDTAVDVDFLGTKMAQIENERVIEEWRKL